MSRVLRRWLSGAITSLVLLAAGSGVARAQRGGIKGTVRDADTKQPIAQAQVTIGSSTVGVLTDAKGEYAIRNVPVGRVELRARTIGYRVSSQVVSVLADSLVQADFDLRESALSLDEIVVTASGNEQDVRSMPSPPTLLTNFDSLADLAPVTNMADALEARTPGVEVLQSSGTLGAGTRIRIRGAGSLSLSNDPIIYIDGVRVDGGASSNTIGVGGQVPSRINDLDPNEIESVEVIKGPSAAALYGTDAANGIINIRTRRGHAGAPVWHAFAEGGSVRETTQWPDNVFGFDTTKTGSLRYGCTLPRISQKLCTQTGGLFSLNPLMSQRPFREGAHAQYGLDVSGGGERLTYFLSADQTGDNGVYHNNDLSRTNLRANFQAAVTPEFDVGVQTGYVQSDLSLPDNDNDALGILGSGLLGSSDTTRQGWGFLLPSQSNLLATQQKLERFTGGTNAEFRPLPWLTMHSTAGIDYSTRFDTRTIEPNQVPFNLTTLQGSRIANTVQTWDYNLKASAQARFRLSSSLTSQTTVGSDYFHSHIETIFASGTKLAAGTNSLAGIGLPSVSEDLTETLTFGVYGEEVIGWRDRVFLTGSLRRDDNSAFGKNFKSILYPKVGASWVLSDESFFPHTPLLSTLRLRASRGVLGLAPGPTDALQYFTPVAVADNGDQVAFTAGNLGNVELKPERVSETELGLDAGLFKDRVNLTLTYYDKLSHDALVSRTLPPSLGSSTSQFFNLGAVGNRGLELGVTGAIYHSSNFSLDVDASVWTNANKLIDLGRDPTGKAIPSIVFGNSQQDRTGFPLGGYWVRPITSYQDLNGDGIIANLTGQPPEVVLDTAFRYIGSPLPTHGWNISPTVTLFHGLRISANFDHRGGNFLYNFTADFRCRVGVCAELNNPKTPLLRQAQMYSDVFLGQPNGYIEPADFTKLRELSISYSLPQSWARRLGSNAVSITVAGRNLHTWTKYTGTDPELNQNGQTILSTADFLTQPPLRAWTFRLNYTF